jgi:hypothetical protein
MVELDDAVRDHQGVMVGQQMTPVPSRMCWVRSATAAMNSSGERWSRILPRMLTNPGASGKTEPIELSDELEVAMRTLCDLVQGVERRQEIP